MINETLKRELESFINRFESESEEIKSQVHYQSVINITEQLAKIANDSNTEKYKTAGVNFFNGIKNIDFPLGKIESLDFYNSYVLKCGQFLTRRKDFRSNADILKYIVLGILLDIGIYYFTKTMIPFYLPISTLTLTFLGYRSRNRKKKKNKYFAIGY